LHQIDKIKENILIKGRDRNKGRCLEKKKKKDKNVGWQWNQKKGEI
jgi:hypothetical protein